MRVLLSTKELYALFLQSDWWRDLSRACKEAAGWRCQSCMSAQFLQAHHLRYPDNWFDTTPADLRCLCDFCHAKEHGLVKTVAPVVFNQPPPKKRTAKRRKSRSRKKRSVPFQKWRSSSGRKTIWKQYGNSSN